MKLRIAPKILLALLLSNAIIILSMAAYLSWNFEKGFKEYLHQIEIEQVSPILAELSVLYNQKGSWDGLNRNHRLWHETLLKVFPGNKGRSLPKHRKDPPGQREREHRPPPLPSHPNSNHPPRRPRGNADDPFNLLPRLSLFDEKKQHVIGQRKDFSEQDTYLPITTTIGVVGWLVLTPSSIVMEGITKRFYDKQLEALMMIAIWAFIFSLLVALYLTRNLTRPIKALAKGTSSLTTGHFNTRISVTSSDELGQLAEDFNNLANTLENNEQSRRRWVADISHELRTPLAILRGEIEAMLDGVREVNDKQLSSIKAEVLTLGKLIEDLYDLSLSDIGALKYRKVLTDPTSLLTDVIDTFIPRFASKEININFLGLEEGQVALLADPTRLSQLFTNLLENSFRYTNQGGEVFVVMDVDNNHVILKIEDSTPGVPDEALPYLFDRLYRVDASRTRSTGGAGLGMSLCNSIVKAHEGEISAGHSDKGGLSVVIKLPITKTGTR